jgi:hypothetical protein
VGKETKLLIVLLSEKERTNTPLLIFYREPPGRFREPHICSYWCRIYVLMHSNKGQWLCRMKERSSTSLMNILVRSHRNTVCWMKSSLHRYTTIIICHGGVISETLLLMLFMTDCLLSIYVWVVLIASSGCFLETCSLFVLRVRDWTTPLSAPGKMVDRRSEKRLWKDGNDEGDEQELKGLIP